MAINKSKILTIIPARAGSKRLKGKNILELAGKPLIQWTIDAALKSTFARDHCYISTDCEKIKSIAQNCGASVPFLRPSSLSTDTATTFDVIKHMIDNLDASFDYVLLLQPTSPLRTAGDIDGAIKLCLKSKFKAIVSITENDSHNHWQVTFNNQNKLITYPEPNKRSQDFEKSYILNGAIYFSEIEYFLKNKGFLGRDTGVYLMDQNKSIDIDTEMDFKLVELLF